MADESVSKFITFAQQENFLAKLRKQTKIHEELIALSCEMFKELYKVKPHSPLIKYWHDIAKELM